MSKDLDYYKGLPQFSDFMKKSGTAAFSSDNDIANFKQYLKAEKKAEKKAYRQSLEGKLTKATNKKGAVGKKKIDKLANKFDLSFASVLEKAQNTEGVKLTDKLSDTLKTNPYKFGSTGGKKNFSDYIAGNETLKGIYKDAGIDRDNLYKGAEQDKAVAAIREEMEDLEIPQLSDKELFQRMEVPKETREKINTFNEKYDERLSSKGKLKFDADGNRYNLKEPEYKNLFMTGDNKGTRKKLRKDMEQFQTQGGFSAQATNLTPSSILGFKSKGKGLLSGMGL